MCSGKVPCAARLLGLVIRAQLAVPGNTLVGPDTHNQVFTVRGRAVRPYDVFSAASLVIVIPSAIQVFAWLATLRRGHVRLATPMLFLLGFFVIFTIGGLTGVMLAVLPFDWQAHDTHFVVAHLHYVLIGGMLFPLFAGFYWAPTARGRPLSDRLGR
jgi:cytochrome c oxidase subunit I+III